MGKGGEKGKVGDSALVVGGDRCSCGPYSIPCHKAHNNMVNNASKIPILCQELHLKVLTLLTDVYTNFRLNEHVNFV